MKVTVIMLAYNAEATIAEAIKSVLVQSINLELLIINDGSIDKTSHIVDNFKDPRIIHIPFKENVGVIKRLHDIDLYVKTDLVCKLDSDDIFLPGAVNALVEGYSPGNFVFGPYLERDLNGVATKVNPQSIWGCLAGGVLMSMNDILNSGGFVSHDIGLFGEYDLYARLINNNVKPIKVDYLLFEYKRRHGSLTMDKESVTDSLKKLKDKWGSEITSQIREY